MRAEGQGAVPPPPDHGASVVASQSMGESSAPALVLLQRIWRLNHAIERTSARMESELGVSAPQRFIIRYIGRHPDIRASELAQLLHVDRGTISATMRRLEEKGLITRERDADDGRRVRLALTARGAKLDRPTAGTIEGAVEQMIHGTSEPDLQTLARLIDCLSEHLEHLHDATPAPRTRRKR